MREDVDILEAAVPATDPAKVYAVTHKALASAIKVIARADDSSGKRPPQMKIEARRRLTSIFW